MTRTGPSSYHRKRTAVQQSAKRVADKYIFQNGDETENQQVRSNQVFDYESQRSFHIGKDIRDVASFIVWQNKNNAVGGVKAKEAFEAFSRLVGIPSKILNDICKGE